MKTTVLTSIKMLIADRLLAGLLLLFIFSCIAFCIYVGVSLHPSDLQVAVHYTAYGETNFYRAKWYYLISFIGFGVILASIHSILTVKLFLQGRRPLALLLLGLSFVILLVAWLLTRSVLKIAFL